MQNEKYILTDCNSSGQGKSELIASHELRACVESFGYTYSHSTNVGSGTYPHGWHLFHSFKHPQGEHGVSLLEGRPYWQSYVTTATARKWDGRGLPELKAHLASKARRYGLKRV